MTTMKRIRGLAACLLVLIMCIGLSSVTSAFMVPRSTTNTIATTRVPPIIIKQQQHSSFASMEQKRRSAAFFMTPSHEDEDDTTFMHPAAPGVVPERWRQLGYLSMLALLSDWICFSVAAAPSTFEQVFQHSAAGLIDIFLFTNVVSCFLVTDLVAKFGLQRSIQAASVCMAVGCWFRSISLSEPSAWLPAAQAAFVPDVITNTAAAATTAASSTWWLSSWNPVSPERLTDGTLASLWVSYPCLVLGTMMVGAAQPFFQCTPPVLSAKWFAQDERATSTAVALNFNQIGIAVAFLVGGAMATTAHGLEEYFQLIALLCTLVSAGTLWQFQDRPPVPPSTSEWEKEMNGHVEPPFLESVQTFFKTKGFARPLAAFVCSISVTNIVGAFIDEIMTRGGVENQLSIDLAGAGFEIAILLGGILLGGFVDRTKEYKSVTLGCLVATMACLIPLGMGGNTAFVTPLILIGSLLGLGLAAGPVQPINAELAVDVAYPGDETAVESVQQVGGNLASALLVPLVERAAHSNAGGMLHGDAILLCALAGMTMCYFAGFDAPLQRSMADNEEQKLFETPEDAAKMASGAVVEMASNATAANLFKPQDTVAEGLVSEDAVTKISQQNGTSSARR